MTSSAACLNDWVSLILSGTDYYCWIPWFFIEMGVADLRSPMIYLVFVIFFIPHNCKGRNDGPMCV